MMRLLTYDSNGDLHITRDLADNEIKPYAILSHTWGKDEEEVTFHDIGSLPDQRKPGYKKIEFCGTQARQDGQQHFWVDTCCIDKANHVELSKAITSMYRWYQQAQVCYVYLADVSSQPDLVGYDWQSDFRKSRWFTRGWTLQELLAPRTVVFYSKEWQRLGTKDDLKELLYNITGISIVALKGHALSQFPIIERMRWTQGRQTKEKEDQAYCLLGIFSVSMSLRYGEGDNAWRRLQKKLDVQSREGAEAASVCHSTTSPLTYDLGVRLGQAPQVTEDYFVGRDGELEKLQTWLAPVPGKQNIVVLHGMGGVGKTQLSIHFVRQTCAKFTAVFWLNAKDEKTLRTGLAALAVETSEPGAAVVGADNEERLVQQARQWLSRPDNGQWLLIYDNYDDPKLSGISSSTAYNIREYFPSRSHGSILITTRSPRLTFGKQLPLKKLDDQGHSLSILSRRSGRSAETDPAALELVRRLDGLPLALATAGTYLSQSADSFEDYLQLYNSSWNDLSDNDYGPEDYEGRTLYSTWNISYQRVQHEDAVASELFALMAYFDNQDLWYELFHAGHDLDDAPVWWREVTQSRPRFQRAVTMLQTYSLLEVHSRGYSLHTCVHDWTLEYLNSEINSQRYRIALHSVANSVSWETEEEYWVQNHRVLPHARRLQHYSLQIVAVGYSISPDDQTYLAYLYRMHDMYEEAEQMYDRALAGREKALGREHTSTLFTVNNLSVLYDKQGRLAEAEQMYNRALAGFEKALGREHTSTLGTVNNFGNLYYKQGKLAEAEQMYNRALASYEKALGREHTLTLDAVNNLGGLHKKQGKLAEAEQMYYRALAGREKALGREHTLTLDTVYNLGGLYCEQGKLAEAEQMYNRALAGFEKALGREHTSTLDTVYNLSNLYDKQGKLAEAEQSFKRVVMGRRKALGPDHLETKKVLQSLEKLNRVMTSTQDESQQIPQSDRKGDQADPR